MPFILELSFKYHLLPFSSTYGKLDPLRSAQEQDIGFVHFPLQLLPAAFGGRITLSATLRQLEYVNPASFKILQYEKAFEHIIIIIKHQKKFFLS